MNTSTYEMNQRKEYETLLNSKLNKSLKGWERVLEIKKDCRDAAIILFTRESLEIEDFVAKHIESFSKMYPKTFILTNVDNDIEIDTNSKISIINLNDEEMEEVLLYVIGTNDRCARVASLKITGIRDAHVLVGFKGIDTDTIVSRGILGIVGETDE